MFAIHTFYLLKLMTLICHILKFKRETFTLFTTQKTMFILLCCVTFYLGQLHYLFLTFEILFNVTPFKAVIRNYGGSASRHRSVFIYMPSVHLILIHFVRSSFVYVSYLLLFFIATPFVTQQLML